MDVRTVAVIGAGTMGAGIAQVCAQTGWQTRLYDAFPEGLEKGMNTIDTFWEKGIARGKTTEEQKAKWSANITQSTDLKESVDSVDLVIEAVPENMQLKQQIFGQLEEMAPSHALLATNTSGLPISAIAESTNCSERVIGMHFFNPVPIMKLLEIVRHDSCSDDTIAAAQSIGSAMGKETILDFKTGNKPRRDEWNDEYYLQLGAYSLAHDKVYGTNIKQGVILLCTKAVSYTHLTLPTIYSV